MDILFFSNIPSPYSIAYINELAKLANVTAVYEKQSFKHRDSSWKFFSAPNVKEIIIMKGLSLGRIYKISFEPILQIWKHRKSRIIIANPLTPCGILAIFFCKVFRISFIIQSEGGLAKDGKGIKERLKKFVMRGAVLYLSGMNPKHDYFLTYGATSEKIKQYPFSSLYKKDFPDRLLNKKEKCVLRNELGIEEKHIILFVGQFVCRKGVDILLNALSLTHTGVGLYLIGGKEKQEYQDVIDLLGLKNIHFMDYIELNSLKKYYMAADLFVLPTREDTWGLVINEAMTYGLPIITTDKCVAGLELIDNGINGYLVPTENPKALAQKIDFLFDNPGLRDKMALNNFVKIKDYNYENMAHVIYNHLQLIET